MGRKSGKKKGASARSKGSARSSSRSAKGAGRAAGRGRRKLFSRFRKGRWFTVAVLLAHVAGFLTSLHAIMSVRTPQGTIAWVVSLNTFPYVTVPAYWVFGRNEFRGYVTLRQSEDQEIEDLHLYPVTLKDSREVSKRERGKRILFRGCAVLMSRTRTGYPFSLHD